MKAATSKWAWLRAWRFRQRQGGTQRKTPILTAGSIETVKEELGVPLLQVNISPGDVEALTTSETKVGFLEALRGAISCLTSDDKLKESPRWILKELPGEYGLSNKVDARTTREKLLELLNGSGCSIALITQAETVDDEWAGKVLCDETGERFGTTRYWIFVLRDSPFTDINYAVVDKTGKKPTICWGFS